MTSLQNSQNSADEFPVLASLRLLRCINATAAPPAIWPIAQEAFKYTALSASVRRKPPLRIRRETVRMDVFVCGTSRPPVRWQRITRQRQGLIIILVTELIDRSNALGPWRHSWRTNPSKSGVWDLVSEQYGLCELQPTHRQKARRSWARELQDPFVLMQQRQKHHSTELLAQQQSALESVPTACLATVNSKRPIICGRSTLIDRITHL